MTTAPAPRPRSRAVMWTGLMLGTALAVLAMMNGVRLRIGGTPPFLGWILGGLIVWLLVVLAATAVAEVLRRHHRTIGRYAGRQAGRGARHGMRLARRHGGRGLNAATRWASGRWQGRQAGPQAQFREPVELGTALRLSRWRPRRHRDAGGAQAIADPNPTPADGFTAVPGDGDAAASPDGTARRLLHMPDEAAAGAWGDPEPDADYGTGPWMLAVRRNDGRPYYDTPFSPDVASAMVRDAPDLRRRLTAAAADPDLTVRVVPLKLTDPDLPAPRHCVACGNPEGGEHGPLVTYDESVYGSNGRPRLIHESHFTDPGTGFYGRPYRPAPAPATTTTDRQHGGNMTTAATENHTGAWQPYTGPGTPRRPSRIAAAPEANGTWRPLIGSTHDFEPESDSHLLGWMAGEAGGMTAYAEAIQDVYETAVNTVGLDPVAMQALHDYADAAASAAEAMAAARQRFADHYSEVRQFAANGGVLPFNGRWMTGEGD